LSYAPDMIFSGFSLPEENGGDVFARILH